MDFYCYHIFGRMGCLERLEFKKPIEDSHVFISARSIDTSAKSFAERNEKFQVAGASLYLLFLPAPSRKSFDVLFIPQSFNSIEIKFPEPLFVYHRLRRFLSETEKWIMGRTEKRTNMSIVGSRRLTTHEMMQHFTLCSHFRLIKQIKRKNKESITLNYAN